MKRARQAGPLPEHSYRGQFQLRADDLSSDWRAAIKRSTPVPARASASKAIELVDIPVNGSVS